MYIVSLTGADNMPRFYTGRSGRYFLSPNKAEAFPYSQAGAERKAALFNRQHVGLGFLFVAEPSAMPAEPAARA